MDGITVIVNTAVIVPINVFPLIDDTDFKSIEASVVYNAAGLALLWNFVTAAGVQTQTAVTPTNTGGVYDWQNKGNGMYAIEIPASAGGTINNDAAGFGWFSGVATGVLPWRGPVIQFSPANVVNSLVVGSDLLDASVAEVAGQTASAAGAVTFPGTIASPTNITAGVITTVTTLTNAPSDSAGVTTLLARLGAFTGTGVNTILGFLKAIASKAASLPSDIGGTFDVTTDSLEGFKDATATAAEVAATTAAAIKLKKNTALSNYPFTLYLTGTRTPAIGKTVTCTKLLDAASAFSPMANTASEVGATGTYRINITTADINGDTGTWKFTALACDPLIIHFVTQS